MTPLDRSRILSRLERNQSQIHAVLGEFRAAQSRFQVACDRLRDSLREHVVALNEFRHEFVEDGADHVAELLSDEICNLKELIAELPGPRQGGKL
jgi:hypothetical protein